MQSSCGVLFVALAMLGAPATAVAARAQTDRGAAVAWVDPKLRLELSGAVLPAGVSFEDYRRAVDRAGRRWSFPEVACANVNVQVIGATSTRSVERDGRSVVVFQRREWCRGGIRRRGSCYSPQEVAVTTLYFDQNDRSRLTEADIELNAVHYSWGETLEPGSDLPRVDLESVLVHELGHALGFAHACRHTPEGAEAAGLPLCAGDLTQSVMNPLPIGASVVIRRALTPHDREELCNAYAQSPAPKGPAALAVPESTGCTTSSSRGSATGRLTPLATGLVATALGWWVRRRTRRSPSCGRDDRRRS